MRIQHIRKGDKPLNEEPVNAIVYPILWVEAPIVNRKKPVKIGICTFAWRPIEKGSLLDWRTFKLNFNGPDVKINEGLKSCSATKHCLNLACPLNQTSFESYCDFHHEQKEYRPKLLKKWPKLIKSMASFVEAAEKCKEVYGKNPNIRFIDLTENGGGTI